MLLAYTRGAGLHDGGLAREAAHVDDLRPAVGEPTIANDEHLLIASKLPRDRFHTKRAAAGHERHALGFVNAFEHARDIAHHIAKLAAHVVERAVGVDHRKFEQTGGVDVGQ